MGQRRTLQNSCNLQTLFSHFIGDSLVFSFTLSVIHAIAGISSGRSALSQIFSPKFQQGVNAFQISYLEFLTTTYNPGNISGSVETILRKQYLER